MLQADQIAVAHLLVTVVALGLGMVYKRVPVVVGGLLRLARLDDDRVAYGGDRYL